MSVRTMSPDPEIYCDFNARMTKRGYLPTNGTLRDLARLGLALDGAIGRRFVFVSEDADKDGKPDDIMHNGTVVLDPIFGVLLQTDDTGFYWRSDLK